MCLITFSDAAGNKTVCNQCVVVTSEDITAPTLNVSEIPDAIALGQSIEITAEASDNSGTVYLTASINGAEIDISNGTAVFTPETAGDYTMDSLSLPLNRPGHIQYSSEQRTP